jgi:hypothetical protein
MYSALIDGSKWCNEEISIDSLESSGAEISTARVSFAAFSVKMEGLLVAYLFSTQAEQKEFLRSKGAI